MITIEPVTTEQEINDTVALAQSIWQQHYLAIIGQDQIDYMLDKFQSNTAIAQQIDAGYLYYIAQLEQDHVGYLALVPNPEQNRLMISKIYVDSATRGAGVGKALFDYTKATAQKLNLDTIWLTVNIDNTDSINWYLKQGFVKVDEVKADIGNGYFMDDYILELKI